MRPITCWMPNIRSPTPSNETKRRTLDRVGDAVEPGRQESAHRLRHDHYASRSWNGKADGLGGIHLAAAASTDRAAHVSRSPGRS